MSVELEHGLCKMDMMMYDHNCVVWLEGIKQGDWQREENWVRKQAGFCPALITAPEWKAKEKMAPPSQFLVPIPATSHPVSVQGIMRSCLRPVHTFF